jgi:abortive infection bacteriophage resistance protein
MRPYTKPALPIKDQIAKWENRGLIIPDKERAKRYLEVISYYRLSAYALPFQVPKANKNDHAFIHGTKFDDILGLYIFDRKLRLLILDAIERIEVGVRSIINNHMALTYGPHWYLDKKIFRKEEQHKKLLDKISELMEQKRKEVFIQHYINNYSNPKFPPSWMMVEILSFGQLTMLCANNLHKPDQKKISLFFNIYPGLFISWIRSLNYVRNLCAHHSRIWNRELAQAPQKPKSLKDSWISDPIRVSDPKIKPELRLYLILAIIEFMVRKVNRASTWHKRLYDLIEENKNLSKANMGMPENWFKDSFWRLSI